MKTIHIILATIMAFSYAISHSAVHLSDDKTGSAIIVPFYTVANQMNTLVSLNNTKDENKAVKIHLKEAKNGDLIASFNVYLTAQDMWTMGMGQAEGELKMVSNDQSCTFGFPNSESILIDEGKLLESGTIEIIEMGVVDEIEPLNPDNLDCAAVTAMWESGGQWFLDSESAMLPATGGLHAEVTLMDVEQGHSANIPLIHLGGFFGDDNIQHTTAGYDTPNLASGTQNSMVIHNGQLIETTWPTGHEAVSALLMKTNLNNEFNIDPNVVGQSEWIVSLPTLTYHRNATESTLPFEFRNNSYWFPHFGRNVVYFNRESSGRESTCALCDPVPPTEHFNYSVTNLRFISYRYDRPYLFPILTSELSSNEYWMMVDLYIPQQTYAGKVYMYLTNHRGPELINNRGRDTSDPTLTHTFYGMPVVGFTYTKFTNANAQPGLLAQYAFVREHFGEQRIEIGAQE